MIVAQPRQAEHGSYPRLLAPLAVRHVRLRNRAIMGSMHTRLEMEPDGVRKQARFYAERAKGEAGLIITGGFAPNQQGLIEPGGPILVDRAHVPELRRVTDAVHQEGGVICLQILHSGRYARQADCVAPSAIGSPINRFAPRAMTTAEIEATIEDFAACAVLAREAGFDGVEVMGSEGYLLNQFAVTRTNQRDDEWGGSAENRHRLPVEIVRRVRAAAGDDFIIIYRISALDLVEGGAPGEEIDALARKVEAAGADILNTGIGWHEARVPTIAYMIPRAAWRFAVARLKDVVQIPLVASNRINMPGVAEEILASGDADLVSMARPFLADPHFVRKAREGRPEAINACIACNQACLDFIFSGRTATCLVNPRACREAEFDDGLAPKARRIAVVGAGAGGLACSVEAARRGHAVTLFEASEGIGGQLNLARAIPGKGEFNELLRYFRNGLEEGNVEIRLRVAPAMSDLSGFDAVVVATGVHPRIPDIPGIDHPSVVTYAELLSGRRSAGTRVAILGAGGIGFDVAEYLCRDSVGPESDVTDGDAFLHEWNVDPSMTRPGGLAGDPLLPRSSSRTITVVQRKSTKPGENLGTSTGWILRNSLRKHGVRMLPGFSYDRIDDEGLHGMSEGEPCVIPVDTIVVCTGQEPNRELYTELRQGGVDVHIIGGAHEALELDALRAIEQGVRLAQAL